jgi:hypothetical protein
MILGIALLVVSIFFIAVIFPRWRVAALKQPRPPRKTSREVIEGNPASSKPRYLGIYYPELRGVLRCTELFHLDFPTSRHPTDPYKAKGAGLRVRCEPPEPQSNRVTLYLEEITGRSLDGELPNEPLYFRIWISDPDDLDLPNFSRTVGKGVLCTTPEEALAWAVERRTFWDQGGDEPA